jgi:hypothetical protein
MPSEKIRHNERKGNKIKKVKKKMLSFHLASFFNSMIAYFNLQVVAVVLPFPFVVVVACPWQSSLASLCLESL